MPDEIMPTDDLSGHQRVRNDATAARLRTLGATVEPALTREEWDEWREDVTCEHPDTIEMIVGRYLETTEPDLHAAAALCLDGQPFGFTREDVVVLRACVDGADREDAQGISDEGFRVARHALAKLAALLPPED